MPVAARRAAPASAPDPRPRAATGTSISSAGPRARFRPTQRLRSPPEFRHVFRHGRARRDPLFTVIAAPSVIGQPRLGLAVSRKAAKLATQRNRVKRLVRHAFRTSAHCLPPLDIVVIARPGIAARTEDDIRRSLSAHWRRLAKQCAKLPTV